MSVGWICGLLLLLVGKESILTFFIGKIGMIRMSNQGWGEGLGQA